jgi:hypothetical protein
LHIDFDRWMSIPRLLSLGGYSSSLLEFIAP